MRRNGLAGLGTSLALVLLLAGCGSAGGGATAAPSAAATPEPTAPLGLFTGHDVCKDAPGNPQAVACERLVSDARLNGTLLSEKPPTAIGTEPAIYVATMRLTLTNDGGSWICDELVMGPMDGGAGWRDQVCVGEDGYAGLTAYIHSNSNNKLGDNGVFGWVEETP